LPVKGSEIQIFLSRYNCRIEIKNKIFLQRSFYGPICGPFESEDLNWEITNECCFPNHRILLFTIRKNPPKGTYIWWSSLLRGDEKIDVTKVKGRRNQNKIWEQAHKLFHQKVIKQKKMEIEV